MEYERRIFIEKLCKFTLSIAAVNVASSWVPIYGSEFKQESDSYDQFKNKTSDKKFFEISLAEWSLHKTLRAGKLTNMEFPAKAKNDFDINAVEYVNQFFMDKARNRSYLQELKQRTEDLGVKNVLIMIDDEGSLGSSNQKERQTAVENHFKWVEAANFLGCHSIRVNAAGEGTAEQVSDAAVKGLSSLTLFANDFDIGVIVENHGGYSSNGKWLSNVMKRVNMSGCGTLPDFGNFCIKRKDGICIEEYDRYKGTEELMPFAKGVSAKSGQFDSNGLEEKIDYYKIMRIVKNAGYKGFVGIEYSGEIPEDDGIRATKKLLEKVGLEIS
jgi:sugar phosphate isomerase/epimerase